MKLKLVVPMKLFFFYILILFSINAQETKESKNTIDKTTSDRWEELEKKLKEQQEQLDELKKNQKKETTSKYTSPMKKEGIHPEYLRNLLLEPSQSRELAKDPSLWVNDIMRIGFQFRPRSEHRNNLDFNSTTDDSINRQSLGTQVWFLIDPHPNITAKLTIQDSRLMGGSPSAPTGDDRRFFFDGAGQIVSPQTFSSNGNCSANTNLTNSNFNTCLSPSQTSQIPVRNATSIREAFVDFKKILGLNKIRLGRQILAYGDQRILGGANWLQNALSFDGVRFNFESNRFSSDLFGVKMTAGQNIQGQTEGANGLFTSNGRLNGSLDDSYLTGIYNTLKIPEIDMLLDFYSIGVYKKWIPSNRPAYSIPNASATTEDRSRQNDELLTTGFRLTNRTKANHLPDDKSWDWTIESVFQSGLTGQRIGASWDPLQTQIIGPNGLAQRNPYITETTGNIYNQSGVGVCGTTTCNGNASTNLYTEKVRYTGKMHVFQTGYTFFKKLRLGVQHIFASGNSNRTSGSNSTYETLAAPRFSTFPIWNNFSGISETLDTKNVKSNSVSISYKTNEFGFFQLAFFDHNKAAKEDSWYGISGAANSSSTNGSTEVANGNPYTINNNPRLIAPSLGKKLFREIDFTWMYNWNEYVSFWFGAAFLYAGDSIKNQREQYLTVDRNQNLILNPAYNSFRKNASVVWFMVTTVF
jgi:hypothetical protein